MMKQLALLAGVAFAMAFARPALAQGPFADVPTDHWGYDAVNELASRGIVNGYPDGTFGGKRALTRYEFAVAIQRMLQDTQRRIDQAIQQHLVDKHGAMPDKPVVEPTDVTGFATKAEVMKLSESVDQLKRLATEFQDTLAALGTDVDQLKRDVAALKIRLAALEEKVRLMPLISGTATTFFRGDYISEGSLARFNAQPAGSRPATDIDNRPITNDNFWQGIRSVYDIDLGITARLSDLGTAHLLLNAGNYLGGYLNNSVSTKRGYGNTTFENVTPYYLYLDMPISALGQKAGITVGKFGHQFTPYTLKLVDVDSYTTNGKTDMGDYPITGGRINFNLGFLGIQAYAGQHNIAYSALTSTGGSLFAGRLGDPLFTGRTNPANVPPVAALIDQSTGVRMTAKLPWKGTLGGTYIVGVGTAGKPSYRELEVFGGDVAIQPFNWLRVEGDYSQSEWRNQANGGSGNVATKDRQAWDGRVVLPFGKLTLTGQYKRIGIGFDAPGNWGKIGRWGNPKGIEGYGGSVMMPLGKRMAIEGGYHLYQIIGARSNEISHYKANVKFGLSESNSIDLGTEGVDWNGATGSNNKEMYYNIGWAHDFSKNANFRVMYQYIDYQNGNFLGGGAVQPGFDYNGGVAVTQFSVKF